MWRSEKQTRDSDLNKRKAETREQRSQGGRCDTTSYAKSAKHLLHFLSPTASKLNPVFLTADVLQPTYANIMKSQLAKGRFN